MGDGLSINTDSNKNKKNKEGLGICGNQDENKKREIIMAMMGLCLMCLILMCIFKLYSRCFDNQTNNLQVLDKDNSPRSDSRRVRGRIGSD